MPWLACSLDHRSLAVSNPLFFRLTKVGIAFRKQQGCARMDPALTLSVGAPRRDCCKFIDRGADDRKRTEAPACSRVRREPEILVAGPAFRLRTTPGNERLAGDPNSLAGAAFGKALGTASRPCRERTDKFRCDGDRGSFDRGSGPWPCTSGACFRSRWQHHDRLGAEGSALPATAGGPRPSSLPECRVALVQGQRPLFHLGFAGGGGRTDTPIDRHQSPMR